MKKTVAITAMSLSLISAQARADEHRPGDAALGALSGAVVLGPIGAVAGAVVGYTAGPSIAHSWGFRHSAARRTRAARQAPPPADAPTQAPEARGRAMPPSEAHASMPTPQAPPAPKTASTSPPPVQTLE